MHAMICNLKKKGFLPAGKNVNDIMYTYTERIRPSAKKRSDKQTVISPPRKKEEGQRFRREYIKILLT
jgi:predicted Zn-ribbon and HTH transcriptional regulator